MKGSTYAKLDYENKVSKQTITILISTFFIISSMYTFIGPNVKAEDWTQTTQTDFNNSTQNDVDTITDPGNVTLSQHWKKAPANPVLDIGAPGEWDDNHVGYPTVLYDGTTYKMWYCGHDGSNWKIGYATSPDGLTWTKYSDNPVLINGTSGSWDDNRVHTPNVLYDGSIYKMWYTGFNDALNRKIGYATSPDGITWTKFAGNPVLINGSAGSWDDDYVYGPSVISNGTIYEMWYSGSDGSNFRIGYATSTDGTTWTKYASNPVVNLGRSGAWDDENVFDPVVIYQDTIYRMWYAGGGGGGNRIGHATSYDGITWAKYANNPVIDMGPGGSWDDSNANVPAVIYDNTKYKIWYTGSDGSNYRIGYAESPLGSSWTKYDTNMVLDLGLSGSWDDTHLTSSTVLYDGTTYKMWYSGNDDTNYRIGYATSPDGITWAKYADNPVLNLGTGNSWDNTSVYGPTVLYNGTAYQMWYSGRNGTNAGIGYATSPDGINWTKNASNPVLDVGPSGSWEETYVHNPTVLYNGTAYQMWYSGYNGTNSRIGYATSPDGINWTKNASNPVLDVGPPSSWDYLYATSPTVLYDGAIYKMWYGGATPEKIGYAISSDGVNWTKFSDNPVLDLGPAGSWDDTGLGSPIVLYDGTTYKMWYAGKDGTNGNYRIGRATSVDGTNWTKDNPVLDLGPPDSWDDEYVENPSVLYNGTTYKMWYTGDDGTNLKIGYATSPDGIIWMKNDSNPVFTNGSAGSWDDTDVFAPAVLYNGTTYQMWYSGYNGTNSRIGYATSPDGINWTKNASNPVLDLGPSGSWDEFRVYAPTVLYNGTTYEMWYTGYDGSKLRIGYATSPDGITWTKYGGNPVLNLSSAGSLDDLYVFAPAVLYFGTTYMMWYSAHDGSFERIGFATSPDGIKWTKYAGNPVLDVGSAGSWDDGSVAYPSVIYDGTTFKMWYSGQKGSTNYRIGYATLSNGTHWWKLAINPVLDVGPPGSWDDDEVRCPTVLYDGTTYKMWYTGLDDFNSRIGYATSPDGITWTKSANNPVLDLGSGGSWDDMHVYAPVVLYNGTMYEMWYSGYNGTNARIGYATSSDGITWTKNASNPVLDLGSSGSWDDYSVYKPAVLYNGTMYEMWYSGYNGTNSRIGYATSSDGITWTKNASNPVLNLGSPGAWDDVRVSRPSVFYDGLIYKMWYSGYDGTYYRIGYATSSDGITWTKYAGNPVLDLGPGGSWDDGSVRFPIVLYDNTTYKIWYEGLDKPTGPDYIRIGYAAMSYQPLGNFTSSVFDSGANGTIWNFINWTESLPPGTNITLSTRSGYSSTPDSSWSSWSTELWNEAGSTITSPRSRYIQYRATFTTTNKSVTPILSDVNINYTFNTAESPSLSSPANNSWVSTDKPTFGWNMNDPEGDSQGGYTVQISDGPLFSNINYTSDNVSSSTPSWTPSSPITEGNWYWRVRTKDIYGLWSNYGSYRKINIDLTTPQISNLNAEPDSWTNINSFTINWTNPGDASGIAGAYYKLDTAPTSDTDGTYNTSKPITGVSVTGNGAHTIYVWLKDNAGNVNYQNYATTTLYFDTEVNTPTGVTAAPNTWTNINSFDVDWTNPADNSGIETGAYYTLDSPPTSDTDGTWVGAKPITGISVTGDGEHTIYVWLKDNIGNINYQNYASTTLYFDSEIEAPTGVTATPDTWTNTNSFDMDWTDPSGDDSGIVTGAYYTLDSPPTSDTDGTWVGAKPITGISVDSEGEHMIYIWLKDNAGNINYQNYGTATLYYDSQIEAPTEIKATPDTWTNTNSFDIDWTNPSDDDSGIVTGAYYKLDSPPTSNTDGTWVDAKPITGISVSGEGEHTIYIWLKDNAGNIDHTKIGSTSVYLDTDKPVANKPGVPGAYNNTGMVKWRWAPSTDTGSGISGYYVCIGTTPGGADIAEDIWTTDTWYEKTGLEDGKTYYCRIKTENGAGTVGSYSENSDGIMVDKSPPAGLSISINDDAEYSNTTDVILSMDAGDGGSGLSQMAFSTDGTTWSDWETYTVTRSYTLSTTEGTKTVYFRVKDNAGNIAEPVSDTIILDTTPPHSLSILINDGAEETNSTDVTLTLNAIDDTSGLHQMSFSSDGSTWGDWVSYKSTKSYTLSEGDGTKTVYFKVNDNAGNIAETVFAEIILNTTPPILDSDNDGFPDDIDAFPLDPSEWIDTDLDKIGNNADKDDDNDGLLDTVEDANGNEIVDSGETDPLKWDTDEDGYSDGEDDYPLDSTKWKKEEEEEGIQTKTWVSISAVLIIVIVLIILIFLFVIRPRKGVEVPTEEPSEQKVEGEIPPERPMPPYQNR